MKRLFTAVLSAGGMLTLIFQGLLGAVVGLAVAGMATAAQGATVLYDEAISGDLPPLNSKSVLLNLVEGENIIYGTTGTINEVNESGARVTYSADWDDYLIVLAPEFAIDSVSYKLTNISVSGLNSFDFRYGVTRLSNTFLAPFSSSAEIFRDKNIGPNASEAILWDALIGTRGSCAEPVCNISYAISFDYQITYNVFDCNNFDCSTLPTTVPLPAAFPLLGGALSLLGYFGWRRKRMVAA